MEKIQPTPGTLAESFIAGCRVGELRLQCCDSCGAYQFYPRIICADCHGHDLSWVALEEGPTMMSHIVACAPEDVAVGLPVRVDFAAWSDSTSLPVFILESRD